MWDRVKEFAEKHPYALGAIVFVTGAVLVYLMFKGGSSSSTSTADPNAAYYSADAAAIESGNSLYAQQMQLQAASQANSDQLSAVTEQYASQEQIAQLGANVATAQISAQQQTTDLGSTLSAAVAGQQITAQQQESENNNSTNVALASNQNATSLAELQAQLNANTAEMTAQSAAFTQALNVQASQTYNQQALADQQNALIYSLATGQDSGHSQVALVSPP